MTRPTYDQAFWEQLWSRTLREHPDKVAHRAPSAHLITAVDGVRPGRALDAGCGHRLIDPATGADTAAAGQTQVSVEAALAALDPRAWEIAAEERPRAAAGSGVDAVVRARRRS